MTHDPLCPCTPTGFDIPLRARDEFCLCDLIAKVRADERSKHEAEIERIYESWSVDVDHQRYH